MVGRSKQLGIGELGQLLGLLTQYQDNLLYEAQEGATLDEDPRDRDLRDVAIAKVSDCIKTVADDLKFRLTEY